MKKVVKKIVLLIVLIIGITALFIGCKNNVRTNINNDKDIVVVFTNDVHCGIEDNIGYAGLAYYYNGIKKQDVYPLLVDAGDFAEGAPIGTLSKGKHLTSIMNKIGYDFVVLGNHDFGYGMQEAKDICAELNDVIFSSNFIDLKINNSMLNAYKIFALGNKKVAFVGGTTPMTFTTTKPIYFQDSNGKYLYSFCEDDTGEALYKNIQESVDAAKKEGADYVVLIGHFGIRGATDKWSSENVIKNTKDIDFCIDGHSHEVYVKDVVNKEGKTIGLAQAGTKLSNIGKLTITKNGEFECEVIDKVVPLEGDNPTLNAKGNAIDDDVNNFIQNIKSQYESMLNEVIYKDSNVDLVTHDPYSNDRIIRKRETNLGDLCADAYKEILEADICMLNGGGIRNPILKGDITYNDCLSTMPFSNYACVAKLDGKTILDALEWGARNCPEENGGFLQVSGITYLIDTTISTPCKKDEKENFANIEGERRIKDVKINGEDIDTNKYYTVAGFNYHFKDLGDGYAMFKGCEIIKDEVMIDNEVLAQYIRKHGTDKYADPYGDGRIKIIMQ